MEVIKFYFTLTHQTNFRFTLWNLGSDTRCENRPICTRFKWKLLINPLRWELTRVCLSTRHVLIHTLEALNQHNSPKTTANPVVPVCARTYVQDSAYAHTVYNQICRHRTIKSSFTHLILRVRYRRVSSFTYKPWAHESHIKQKLKVYWIYMLSWSSTTISTY